MATEICLKCPICLDAYSKERCPVSPQCGHSICSSCAERLDSNDCVTCKQKSFRVFENLPVPWYSSMWAKNFALIELLQLHENAQKVLREEYTQCSGCKLMEKKEKLKICDTCASEWELDWEREEEEKVLPYVLCAFCCMEKHKDHEWVNFWPWKLQKLLPSTVAEGKSRVSQSYNACYNTVDSTRRQVIEWNKTMNSCLALKFPNYQHGITMANRLKREADRVVESADICLPKLAKYRKVVQESSNSLWVIHQECVEAMSVYVGKTELNLKPHAWSICYDYVNYVRITVSSAVTLSSFKMTGVGDEFVEGQKGKSEIYDNEFDKGFLNDQFETTLWKGVDVPKMVPLMQPVQFLPGTDYLLKFFVDGSNTELNKEFCIKQEAVHKLALPNSPPCSVTVCEYFDHVTTNVNKDWQLAGFYFSPYSP